MPKFRVVAEYNWPPMSFGDEEDYEIIQHEAEIVAEHGDDARLKALFDKEIPALILRHPDSGEPELIYWNSNTLGGRDLWPTVVDESTLAWGDEDETGTILCRAI